jgi:hypothetical protein
MDRVNRSPRSWRRPTRRLSGRAWCAQSTRCSARPIDVIAAAAAAYELSTDSHELFSKWLMEALTVRMSELVAATTLSESHSDSAEHDRDAGGAAGCCPCAMRWRCLAEQGA